MAHLFSRRDFLHSSCCKAGGSMGLLSTLLNLRMAGSAAGQSLPGGDDYRALVCLFFAGGMDSFNLLTPAPSAGARYDTYVLTRGGVYNAITNEDGLALPSILPLASHPTDPFSFGIHPRCADDGGRPGMASLYAQGDLAFVANVGTLAERLTKSTYNNSTARRPRGLYSHSDQQQQWQTSFATEAKTLGWAGLAADLLHAGNQDARVSMNLSISGNNTWQTGRSVFNYNISSTGSSLPSEYNSPYSAPAVGGNSRIANRTAGIDNQLLQEHQNLLERTFARNFRESIDASAVFKDSFDSSSISTLFPGDPGYVPPAPYTAPVSTANRGNDPAITLGQQLKAVLRSMKVRNELGLRRQTFFVSYGGWDHHDEVINSMNLMVDVVNRCLAAYWEALGELTLRDAVTLFTASDFARTLTSNGAGSDHAWGGNAFVLGGSVHGGRVHGIYPDLSLSGPDLVTSRGAAIPGLAVDEYFAELALWLGVTPGNLDSVLPRIRNFYLPGGQAPVGFLNI